MQDEIIRMARDAGLEQVVGIDPKNGTKLVKSLPPELLERFAALVAAHVKLKNAAAYYEEGYEAGQHDEREACIEKCKPYGLTGECVAIAIRARGK